MLMRVNRATERAQVSDNELAPVTSPNQVSHTCADCKWQLYTSTFTLYVLILCLHKSQENVISRSTTSRCCCYICRSLELITSDLSEIAVRFETWPLTLQGMPNLERLSISLRFRQTAALTGLASLRDLTVDNKYNDMPLDTGTAVHPTHLSIRRLLVRRPGGLVLQVSQFGLQASGRIASGVHHALWFWQYLC